MIDLATVADTDPKASSAILFVAHFRHVGGAERVLLEEAEFFQKQGINVKVCTFYSFSKDALFDGSYDVQGEQIGKNEYSRDYVSRVPEMVRNTLRLRRRIRKLKPSIILASTAWDCVYLYFATLLTAHKYATHIHDTLFWDNDDTVKYSLFYKKAFDEIMGSVPGHKQFNSTTPVQLGIFRRLLNEIIAVAVYLAVRKAKKIFVLSNHMRWEVFKLYKRDAIVTKGAFPKEILAYTPKKNFKNELSIEGELLLNINRLDPKKRIDVLLRSFEIISHTYPTSVLVIGGVGPDEQRLKSLVSELDLGNRVRFVGYVKETERWDLTASCDVFAHPNWADFAIAAYEPLALQKKVVWSTEMELDDSLVLNRHIFRAEPTVQGFAQALKQALSANVYEINDVSQYTWENYCSTILSELVD